MIVKHRGRPVLFHRHLLSRTLGEAPVSLADVVSPVESDNKVQDLAMLLSILSSLFLILRK